MRKVPSLIVTGNTGITKTGIPVLSKYPGKFAHFAIRPVSHPLVMSKIKYAVNEVDSHNKSRQSDLALEKFWVTQCGWLRLCTAVATGMTINNCWKLFRYGFTRDHYEKCIGIREFLERLAQDCFNNPFSPDSGTPAKNTPPPKDKL